MSSFTVKSYVVAKRDMTGLKGFVSVNESSNGNLREVIGVEKTPAPIIDAGSKLVFCPIPSMARIVDVDYAKETTGTTALDVAVFYPTVIPKGGFNTPAQSLAGTLISSTAFATNIAGSDLGVGWTSALGLATGPTLQAQTQPLWQLLGLSVDPGIDLDMGFTVRTATVEQGYVGLRVKYAL